VAAALTKCRSGFGEGPSGGTCTATGCREYGLAGPHAVPTTARLTHDPMAGFPAVYTEMQVSAALAAEGRHGSLAQAREVGATKPD